MTKSLIAAASLAAAGGLLPEGASAQALQPDPVRIVKPLYDALTASSPSQVRELLESVTSTAWQNCSTNETCETREATIVRWSARISSVPDLKFEMKDVMTSGSRVIVRGEVSGRPVGPFFGVDPQGREFRLMTIDVHEIQGGKVVSTHHVEDWRRAVRQLSGESL